jgi:hypothetical protein
MNAMGERFPARVIVLLALLGGPAAACGPHGGAVEPAGGGGADAVAAVPDEEELRAECERLFQVALSARIDRALGRIDAAALRAAVLATAVAQSATDGPTAVDARALAQAVLTDPAVREQLLQAMVQASGDGGVMVALGTALFSGGIEQRLVEAAERAQDALVGAFRRSGLDAAVLALPEVRELLAVLLPTEPFGAAVAVARASLVQARSVADAALRLIVPGDVEATRSSVDAWAAQPAGIGWAPLVRSFPFAESVAGLPAAAAALDALADAVLTTAAVREETIVLVRELLADASFRLALDELFVRLLRGDPEAEVESAARAVVGSPALPQAASAWAVRLLARRGELPGPVPALAALAADADLASVLLRFLDVLATSEGCVGL